MRLELIDGIRTLIMSLLVYIPIATLSGYFTAWVAKKVGDDLPERMGYLTLDPFSHFSVFGFSLLLLSELFGEYLTFFRGFPGFGRFIIFDPVKSFKPFKTFCLAFARGFAYFLLLTFGLVFIILLKKYLIYPVIVTNGAPTPFLIVLKDLLAFFITQSVILCEIYCLFGIADFIAFNFNIQRMVSYQYFMILIVVLIFLRDGVNSILNYYMAGLQLLTSWV